MITCAHGLTVAEPRSTVGCAGIVVVVGGTEVVVLVDSTVVVVGSIAVVVVVGAIAVVVVAWCLTAAERCMACQTCCLHGSQGREDQLEDKLPDQQPGDILHSWRLGSAWRRLLPDDIWCTPARYVWNAVGNWSLCHDKSDSHPHRYPRQSPSVLQPK